jgi:hypothetical protein
MCESALKVTFTISCRVRARWWSLPTLKYRTFIVNFTLTYLLLTRGQRLRLICVFHVPKTYSSAWNLIVFSVVSRSAVETSVGIAARYGLDGPGIESRLGGGGEIFRTCPDRPWVPPSLLHNGYLVFPGGRAAGAWRLPPTPSCDEVKERVEL